jgi:hypothetical protein
VEETIVKLISQLGFPIFVAAYFMLKMEKHLEQSNKLMTLIAERLGVEEHE